VTNNLYFVIDVQPIETVREKNISMQEYL